MDNDGRLELYAAGAGGYSPFSNGGGSAYIWKSTGLDSGYVAWWDTTSMSDWPSGVAFTMIDSVPCVINNVITALDGRFYIFGFFEQQYQLLWQSQIFANITYFWHFSSLDMDQDGKMDFVVCKHDYNTGIHTVCDWEQTSSGVGFQPVQPLPQEFTLDPISPNPFNAVTAISYKLQVASYVSLRVYDTAGRLVATLANGWQAAGMHEAAFEGSRLASGIYVARLAAGNYATTQKLVLLK
jgi:hypothetical protein